MSIFLISNIKGANGKYEFLMLLILGISIAIAFSEKTVTYKLSNNKFCYYLEKLSLPIYLNQIWIILLVDKYLKQYNFKIKLIIAVIATILISAIIMFVTIYWLSFDNLFITLVVKVVVGAAVYITILAILREEIIQEVFSNIIRQ